MGDELFEDVSFNSLFSKVREESEANVRREAEAVEQVKRSVQAAEQARMEKHELEFEIEQLKMQVRQIGHLKLLKFVMRGLDQLGL